MAKSSSQWTGELDELFDRAVFTVHVPVFIYLNLDDGNYYMCNLTCKADSRVIKRV
jgi:hypothetical protein